MRSVTSCFNSTLYRKTMARFWPMWALYSVLWLFICPLLLLNEYFDTLRYSTLEGAQTALTRMARELPQLLQPGVWLSCLAGVLAAMAVFGYLYNNRSAAMIHGLPMRRDALFFTQYLAGLSFLLLPLASGVGVAPPGPRDLQCTVAPLGCCCAVAAWHSRPLPLTSDVG